MKKFPVLSILYYGFTIILGIILAFYFFAYGEQLKISDTLKVRAQAKDSLGITRLLTGYQNNEAVLKTEVEGIGQLDVYEAVSTYTYVDTSVTPSKNYVLLEKGYLGIITNVSSDWQRAAYTNADGKSFNKFGLQFNGLDKDSNQKSYNYRIGYCDGDDTIADSELSEIKNRYLSYEVCGFYYFQIGDRTYNTMSQIDSIDFLDNQGNVISGKTITLDTPWKLDTPFFNTVDNFVTEYNALLKSGDATQEKVNELSNKFLETYNQTETFVTSDYKEVVKNVYLFSVIKIVVYALVVLIIGDFLVGKHYIIHFFQRLFGKKKKDNVPTNDIPEYINKHELNTTFEASVPDNYKKEITIKYISEENTEIVFNLKPSNGYKETKLIMSGEYSHPEIIADGAHCLDVPSLLRVNGLTFNAKFIFERNKEEN